MSNNSQENLVFHYIFDVNYTRYYPFSLISFRKFMKRYINSLKFITLEGDYCGSFGSQI